jgi:hypothetical protein
MRARPFLEATLAVFLASGASGCSVVLDWDELTNGQPKSGCGDAACAPETVWPVPCHSVFVHANETNAFVTRYGDTSHGPPGLYLVDLREGDPAAAGVSIYNDDGHPAAGIAGNGSDVVFATRHASGGVFLAPTANPMAASKFIASIEAFGVALSDDGNIYWAEGAGNVVAKTQSLMSVDSWDIPGQPYYLAVSKEIGDGDVAYVAYNVSPGGTDMGQVARLVIGEQPETVLGAPHEARGIAVRKLARPDGEVVPHIFVVTAGGAKMAWRDADLTFKVVDLGGAPANPDDMVPGEIVVDATYAYWAIRGKNNPGGDVFRKAHHGDSPAESLGENEQDPIGLSLVDNMLYWCSNSEQGLRRLTLTSP